MAFELGCNLSGTNINTYSSWTLWGLCLNDVVELGEILEVTPSAELAISIDWPEYFLGLTLRVCKYYTIRVPPHEYPEYKEKE